MAAEPQKRPGSRSPPIWQRPSHPASSPTTTSAPAQSPSSSLPDGLKSDTSLQPVQAPRYLDLNFNKNEKDIMGSQPPSTSVATAPAPNHSTSLYPPGPPPPYSSCYPASSLPASAPQSGECYRRSPPTSRRESREEAGSETSQKLPSISEALKLAPMQHRDPQQQTSVPPPPPPPPPPFPVQGEVAQPAASAIPTIFRSLADSRQPSVQSSFSSQQSPHHAKPPDLNGQRPYAPAVTGSPRIAQYQPYSSKAPSPTDAHGPRISPRLPAPPTSAAQQYSQTSLPPPPTLSYPPRSYPPSAPVHQASVSQAPHPYHPPYPSSSQGPSHSGYRSSYPSGSGFSFPPPQTSGLSYDQSFVLSSHQQWAQHAELEKVEEQRRAAAEYHAKRGNYSGAGYGLTVKRHLDDFDLENSLNEVAERTQDILAFSRTYGSEASRYARSTVPVSHLPAADKVAEMINQSIAITDALRRLQNTVDGMRIAAAEEQARQQQQNVMPKPGMYPPYGADTSGQQSYGVHPGQETDGDKGDLGAGGFAGADPKKPRRGRNAPPGRCHSCNRAETPEWRRGPDGARTLCNACGLHYAKLTRKMGAKAGQSGGSNLRPKDGEDPNA